MKAIVSILSILITCSITAQTKLQNQLTQIDSLINSKLEEDHPGIAVGIVHEGEIIYEKYRGLSNLQHQVKFNQKTRSNIASTAKQFTALMILDLVLKNQLNLEDDLRMYLPSLYPKAEAPIKIRHLINHTSGVRDYVELLDMEGAVWWKRFGLDNDDILELLEGQDDLGFKPGSTYSYSNSNYIVLTKVIEKITNKTFNEYSKIFFEELGMLETSFVERYMKVIPNRANPYSDWGRGEWWEVPTVTKTNGEGFLFTTLKDQLHYEQLVQKAVENKNQLLIKSQQSIENSEIKTYGFGLELEDVLGRKSIHHSGGTYGFHSQTYRFPEEKLTIFIMSNNGNISSNLIAKEIVRVILPKSNNSAKYSNRYFEKTEDANVTHLGYYTYPNENSMLQIIEKNGKTYWKEKNFTVEMFSEGKTSYAFTNNQSLKVKFYPNQMIEYYPSGKTMVYKKRENSQVNLSDLNGLVGIYYNKELDVKFEMKLVNNDSLKLKLQDDDFNDVIVYNKDFMLAGNYFLKIKRDLFDRVNQILLTNGRALNIKFTKKINLKFQPEIKTENGFIQVSTITSKNGETSDILLTANYSNGNEIWSKRLGGNNYDKASSILATEDGYLIIGSTSSYGVGNYDFYIIKTDKKGRLIWQNTYGKFDNDYAYSAEKVDNGFLIKGTTQLCNSKDVLTRKCTTNGWFVLIDYEGVKISENILEEIKE